MGGIARQPGWEKRLAAYLSQDFQFDWGKVDCCTFAAGAVKSLTGVNPLNTFHYRNKKQALEVLSKNGGLEAGADALLCGLGLTPALPAKAKRGDIVLAKIPFSILGVCSGPTVSFVAPSGIDTRPITSGQLARAWLIP